LISSAKKSFDLIEARLRPLTGAVMIAAFLSSLLEAAGVGMVFVVFGVIQGAGLDALPPPLRALFGDGIRDPGSVVYVCAILMALLLAKTGTALLTAWLKATLLVRIYGSLSRRLVVGYLALPMSFHIRANSSELVHNTINASYIVTHSCIGGWVDLVVDLMTILFIMVLMCVASPAPTAVAVACLGLLGYLYWRVARDRLARWGAIVNERLSAMQKTALQAFQGIKTIKVFGREASFVDLFRRDAETYGRYMRRGLISYQLPRHALEIAVAAALLGTLSAVVLAGTPAAEIVPHLMLLGAAAYRLMPALIRVSSSLQALKFGDDALTTLHKAFDSMECDVREKPVAATGRPRMESIAFEGVGYSYGAERAGAALVGVTFKLRRGEIVAFTGASGAGKTTLLDILLGLLEPSSGVLRFNGVEMADFSTLARGLFGYVPQDTFVIDDSLRRNVALGDADRDVDDAQVRAALDGAALGEFVASLPNDFATDLGDRGARLSGGQRQRLGVARALYTDADVLVFDEPTAALDSVTESAISGMIERLRGHRTVVIVTHRLAIIRNADRIYHMNAGRIVAVGTFPELMSASPEFREMADRPQRELADAASE
jgi:ATP-binding cassette subfamily C protein